MLAKRLYGYLTAADLDHRTLRDLGWLIFSMAERLFPMTLE